MTVTVEAVGFGQNGVPASTTMEDAHVVSQVIQRLDVPRGMGVVILVNGRLAHWGTILQDGDSVQLIATIGGG